MIEKKQSPIIMPEKLFLDLVVKEKDIMLVSDEDFGGSAGPGPGFKPWVSGDGGLLRVW
jgi:hypothetical protein